MDAADMNLIMGMFTAMAALIVGSIWNQHRESANIRSEGKRDLERATDKLSAEFTHFKETEFNELKRTVDKNHDDLKQTIDNKHDDLSKTFEKRHDDLKQTFDNKHDDLKQTVDKNHETTQGKLDKITDSLADARERLARIEGHLAHGRWPLRADDEPGQDTTNAA